MRRKREKRLGKAPPCGEEERSARGAETAAAANAASAAASAAARAAAAPARKKVVAWVESEEDEDEDEGYSSGDLAEAGSAAAPPRTHGRRAARLTAFSRRRFACVKSSKKARALSFSLRAFGVWPAQAAQQEEARTAAALLGRAREQSATYLLHQQQSSATRARARRACVWPNSFQIQREVIYDGARGTHSSTHHESDTSPFRL